MEGQTQRQETEATRRLSHAPLQENILLLGSL